MIFDLLSCSTRTLFFVSLYKLNFKYLRYHSNWISYSITAQWFISLVNIVVKYSKLCAGFNLFAARWNIIFKNVTNSISKINLSFDLITNNWFFLFLSNTLEQIILLKLNYLGVFFKYSCQTMRFIEKIRLLLYFFFIFLFAHIQAISLFYQKLHQYTLSSIRLKCHNIPNLYLNGGHELVYALVIYQKLNELFI